MRWSFRPLKCRCDDVEVDRVRLPALTLGGYGFVVGVGGKVTLGPCGCGLVLCAHRVLSSVRWLMAGTRSAGASHWLPVVRPRRASRTRRECVGGSGEVGPAVLAGAGGEPGLDQVVGTLDRAAVATFVGGHAARCLASRSTTARSRRKCPLGPESLPTVESWPDSMSRCTVRAERPSRRPASPVVMMSGMFISITMSLWRMVRKSHTPCFFTFSKG